MTPRPTLNRELLLKLVFVMKTLPLRWWYNLSTDFITGKTNLVTVVHSAEKAGFLEVHTEASGDKYLYLTQKGFNRVSEILPASYSYTNWTRRANRSGTISLEHHYLVFRFLLDFFNFGDATVTRILSDYDSECKFEFTFDYRKHTIAPDGLIYYSASGQDQIIALEADTGTEVVRKIYDKLLKYFMLGKAEFQSNLIANLHIYFSFKSEARLNSIFYPQENGVLFSMFHDSVCKLKEASRSTEIFTEDIMELLKDKKIDIYAGLYNQGFENYKNVSFLERLLEQRPSLQQYLNF